MGPNSLSRRLASSTAPVGAGAGAGAAGVQGAGVAVGADSRSDSFCLARRLFKHFAKFL